ncbi:yippee-like protein [Gonapodya prolifera JEL478]|uniref:Protein yippee-like n=1 Tax=Gonapodya prolifera (strain JEL478) TaxID=1344416 RepID=A0A138ZYF8_GONPJ|nr:yippee-like protein [Gonapodya prolifera JEL478]|eukprot:KXS09520.1 yippee-like protein [Gonapodya prolifera JEL478]
MGKVFQTYLDSDRVYTCTSCHAHLASHDDIISKTFTGRHGRAYLFNFVENVSQGQKEDRVLMTGLHTVCDIHCNVCQTVVGWKYLFAFEESQKYKEGKYVVEKTRIAKEANWS